MARTAGDQLWATFRALGADFVFGLPGSQTIDAFQALKRSRLRTVVATHEMAAAFMANGYARVTGRPSILTTIPGPGFTFALTGLAEAWLDSVPIVYVVPAARNVPGREFALQAIDQRAMARPIVKRIFEVKEPDDVESGVVEAYRLSTDGEPGPVMLEIPEEVFGMDSARGTGIAPPAQPYDIPLARVDEVAALIDRAPRVLLYLGAGAIDYAGAARSLADATGAAIVTSTTARGILPEDDSRVILRDPGVQDVEVLNAVAARADLTVVIGCKFSHNASAGFRLQLQPDKLVTINMAGPSKNYPARVHVTSDAGKLLELLLPRLRPRPAGVSNWNSAELAAWREQALRFERVSSMEPRLDGTDTPVSALLSELRSVIPDDAIVVTDSGLHQMSLRRHFTVRHPRGLIVPTNFQSMSYALPAAMGAALAAPQRRVVAVVGDGGMTMSGLELVTAVRERIPLTVVVFNDGAFGLIRNSQLADHGDSHGTELKGPDFEALAAATGADYRLLGADGLDPAMNDRESHLSSVRLVEVLLVDSPGLTRARTRGKMRTIARRLVSPKRRALISRLLRR
jgi:acetolactate synthase-1/2/3 large subunit